MGNCMIQAQGHKSHAVALPFLKTQPQPLSYSAPVIAQSSFPQPHRDLFKTFSDGIVFYDNPKLPQLTCNIKNQFYDSRQTLQSEQNTETVESYNTVSLQKYSSKTSSKNTNLVKLPQNTYSSPSPQI